MGNPISRSPWPSANFELTMCRKNPSPQLVCAQCLSPRISSTFRLAEDESFHRTIRVLIVLIAIRTLTKIDLLSARYVARNACYCYRTCVRRERRWRWLHIETVYAPVSPTTRCKMSRARYTVFYAGAATEICHFFCDVSFGLSRSFSRRSVLHTSVRARINHSPHREEVTHKPSMSTAC
jgi:hypothetical protein